MSTSTTNPGTLTQGDDVSATEASLGKALVLIQKILPDLDEPARAYDVQSALRRAAAFLESARHAHADRMGVAVASHAHTAVEAEIVAVIAAAMAITLGRPYKLVSVQATTPVTPLLNVWAIEGRTQIFQSHRIR